MRATPDLISSRQETSTGPYARWRWPVVAAVGGVAFVTRLMVVLTSGGLLGQLGNDPGVYFTAASALTFGQIPYRDFYLVHPPVLAVVLTPFALLARLTSDPVGFAAANVFAMVVGALNAMLVVRLGWRLLGDFRSAVAGGFFYAVWLGAVGAEFSARLEPFGTLFFLGGLLVLHRSHDDARRWWGMGAGILFGLATLTKIWWIVPVVVVLGWRAVRDRGVRRLTAVVVGGLATLVVVLGPFWLAAGRALWDMVFLAQVGRGQSPVPWRTRMAILAVGPDPTAPLWRDIVTIALGVCLVACMMLSWTKPPMRCLVVVLVAQLVLLGLGPAWFPYYAGYVSAPLALIVAGACAVCRGAAPPGGMSGRVVQMMAIPPALLALTLTAVNLSTIDYVARIEARSEIAATLAPIACVTSEFPTVLIQVDAMSRGLAHSCPNWVDVPAPRIVEGEFRGPGGTRAWRSALVDYLDRGDAILLTGRQVGLTRHDLAELAEGRVVIRFGPWTVYLAE